MKLTLLSASVLLSITPALPAKTCQKDISLSAIKDDSQVPIRLCKGATVIIKDLDPIAKSYRLDAKATVVEDGVDLSSLGFIPVPSSGSATKAQSEATNGAAAKKTEDDKNLTPQPDRDKLDNEFTAIRKGVDALGARSDDPLSTYQGKIQDLTQTVSDLTARIAAFRRQSNLEEDRAKTLINGFIEEIDRVRKNKWPSKEEAALQNDLNDLSNRLAALPVDYSSVFQTWQVEVVGTTTKRTLYDERVKRVAEVQKFVKDAQQTKSDWQAAVAKLNPVYGRFQDIATAHESYFKITYTLQSCSIFGSKTVLTLYSTDLTVDKPQEQSKELATLICDPPLSLSGGFVFSNLDEREYSFVPPATTATPQAAGDSDASANQIIGLTKDSKFRATPLLLLNVRLLCLNDLLDLHYSFGGGVDLKGKVGNDLEFHTGPSLSVANRLFLTPGVYIGRTVDLQSGFTTGAPGYSGIQEPPLVKHYHMGFGFSITYKLK